MPILRTIRLRSDAVRSATSRRPRRVGPAGCVLAMRQGGQVAARLPDRFARAAAAQRAVHQPLDQAVRREAIGAVQARSTSPRPRPTGPAASSGRACRPSRRRSCSARPGRTGMRSFVMSRPKLAAHAVDAGEAVEHHRRVEVRRGRGRRSGAGSAPSCGRWRGRPRRGAPVRPAGRPRA